MIPYVENLREHVPTNLKYELSKLLVVGGNSGIFIPEGYVGTTGTNNGGVPLVGCLSTLLDFGSGAVLTHYGVPPDFHKSHLDEIIALMKQHNLSFPPVGVRLSSRGKPPMQGKGSIELDRSQQYGSYVDIFYKKLTDLIGETPVGFLEYPFDVAVQVTFYSGRVILDEYSSSNPRLSLEV